MAKPSYAFTDLTAHPTTLSGYGITDAKIASGVITLGSNTITPVTSVNGHTGSSVSVTASDLGLASALKYVGAKSSLPTATDSTTYSTYNNGDVITVFNKEYAYVKGSNAAGSSWVELGDEGSYKLKQTAITKPTAVTNKWASAIGQDAHGVLTVDYASLDTSGTWSGNANTATTATWTGKGHHTAAITANEFTPAVGTMTVLGNVSNSSMSHTNNANAELIIKTHPTSGTNYYEARLGFSSNGSLYYMPVNTTTWKTIAYTDSNITGNAATATNVAWTGVTGAPGNATDATDGFMSSEDKAKLDSIHGENTYYVVGPDTDTTAGTWTGVCSDITSYYDGLTIIYVPHVAGASTTKLNINGLGAIQCYLTDKGAIAALTTHYPIGTPIPFTYVNGKFIHADYSSADTKLRVYTQTTGYNDDYPILVARIVASTLTAKANGKTTDVYGVIYNTNAPTLNPSTGVMKIPGGIIANVTGNADTATKLSANASNTTASFWRGDNAWSNILTGAFWIKYNTPNFYIKDTNTGADTYSIIRFGNSSNDNAAYIFLNGPSRTSDGGANLMTIRNNVGNLRLNNNVLNTGVLTVGTDTLDTNYKLKVNGTSLFTNTTWIQGPLRIGNSDAAANTGYATANSGSTNYIAFYGVYGDHPGGFDHTYIGESIYGSKTTANEQSELLLFHGNDPRSGSGPDRIRLLAGQIDLCIYTAATAGTWDTIRQTAGTKVANFANGQVTITGNLLPEANNTRNLGSSSVKWANVYATIFTGNLTGNVTGNVSGSSGSCTGNASTASKIAAKLASTTKTFLLGTSTTITGTAANVDLIGDTGVYLTTTAGQLSAKSYSINDGTNEKVRLAWNATDQSLDFIFA